ncbi:MAG: thiamine phosphate synthase [Acidobacteria bacterium]|nr:MAG: thiamine phosphate synthase [Acidobacteriota bacterium]
MKRPALDTVHLVTRSVPGGWDRLCAHVEACLAAGIRIVQFRDKEAPDREKVRRVRELLELARRHAAIVLVNDRLDVALAAGADGVHLGADDLPWEAARRLAPPPFVLGCTAATPERIARAKAAGADYVGAGPAAPSRTKPDTGPRLDGPAYAALARAAAGPPRPIPLIAVGGITAREVPALVERGVAGVAVSAAVLLAEDPGDAAARLVRTLETARRGAAGEGSPPGLT